MVSLIHLIITLFKITILAIIYATLTLLIFKLIAKFQPNSWFDRITRKKFKFWFISGFIISGGLFWFMFSHFGKHGFGDSARIPIGHFRSIQEIDGIQAYIQDVENGVYALDINKFYITDDFVYGITGSHYENYNGGYFLYDLDKNKVRTFELIDDYKNELIKIGLEPNVEYKEFNYYYKQYWNGWRFWLLP
ncbi:hypothetical protein RCC89_19660 [Cytophagaceae bacterium ABcell3]|nr:hypothetical protein RCC89_03550 [Cytophagaceae bacterium ABcell3]WMJ75358.1 hypothetical protein RCC89_19660 [Cytophagaceae bacterium ABcell3]